MLRGRGARVHQRLRNRPSMPSTSPHWPGATCAALRVSEAGTTARLFSSTTAIKVRAPGKDLFNFFHAELRQMTGQVVIPWDHQAANSVCSLSVLALFSGDGEMGQLSAAWSNRHRPRTSRLP